MIKPILWSALAVGAVVVGASATFLRGSHGQTGEPVSTGPFQVGTNVDAIAYWSAAAPLLDLMKSSGAWIAQSPEKWDSGAPISLDDRGWPRSLPRLADGRSGSLGLIVIRGAGSAAPPRARYVVLYEGKGSIGALLGQGTDVIESLPGRLVVRSADDGSVHLRITATDPDGSGDHIRNVRIVREDRLAEYQKGQLFNPQFLAKIRGFKVLRFMDWMASNELRRPDGSKISFAQGPADALAAPEIRWVDRPLPADAHWDKGIPAEAMVALANEVGAEPWFNMPINASDDYVRGFATFVRQHLRRDLNVYVELSNEVWNGGFPQHRYAKARAEQMLGPGANWMEWYGMRTAQVGRIWNEVFREAVIGGGDPGRARIVFGTQFVYKGLETPGLETPRWKENGHDLRAADYFDVYAIASYYDAGMNKDANVPNVMSWWRLPDGGYEKAISGLRETIEKVHRPLYSYHAGRAANYGLSFATYEAGYGERTPYSQHNNDTYTQFLINVQRRPEMYELDLLNAEAFRSAGGTLFVNFGIMGRPSKWGSWSALEGIGQESSPRYRALRELMRQSSRSSSMHGAVPR